MEADAMKSILPLWDVYASDGRGKRKDRRNIRATTATEALDIAAKQRGWRPMIRSRATRISKSI